MWEIQARRSKRRQSSWTVRKSNPLPSPRYIALAPIRFCGAEIKINSFVSCDLFIRRSAGLRLSVTLMEKLKSYYQMIRLCQVLFYSLIFLVQGEVPESWRMSWPYCRLWSLDLTLPFKITVAGERGLQASRFWSQDQSRGLDDWGPCHRTEDLGSCADLITRPRVSYTAVTSGLLESVFGKH